MSALKSRLARLEKGLYKQKNNLVTVEVISVLDKDWHEHEAEAKRKYLEKHDSLDGLWIIRSKIPHPSIAASRNTSSLSILTNCDGLTFI